MSAAGFLGQPSSPATTDGEAMRDRQPVEQAQGEGARLVGDDAERHARSGEPLESFADGRIERRRGADGLRVRGLEALDRRRHVGAGAPALQGALDQGGDAAADQLAHLRFGQGRQAEVGEGVLERKRDLAGGIGKRAIEVEQNGANRMHENRRHNETGAWLAPEGDSMHLKWLIAALALGIVSRPALADTITVVTSFPKELTNAYKAAYEKKYPNDKVEILNKGTSAGIAYVREQPAGSRAEIFWASAPDAFEVLASAKLLQKVDVPTNGIPDKIGNYPINDPEGLYRGQALAGYGLMWNTRYMQAQQAAGAEGMGRPRRSRSTSATSRPRRLRARARPTSPSRPSCRARAGTRAGTRSCRSPATAPRSPSAASACPTACRTASSASAS